MAGLSDDLALSDPAVAALRGALPEVAERTVRAIIADVPSYAGALTGPMGSTIQQAVQLALGGFVSLVSRGGGTEARTPTAGAVRGAYDLGRGEARSGRSMEALLAAYRIGARVSWRELSRTAVEHGVDAATLAEFAELVFAFIDELSASSAAGHSDELAASGRVRRRHLERIAHLLLEGAPADAVHAAVEAVEWTPPTTLAAVVVPSEQTRAVLAVVDPASLAPADELPMLRDGERTLLLVPDASAAALREALARRDAAIGPAVPWLEARSSVDRVARALDLHPELDGVLDTDDLLAELVVHADPAALAALRERALAPLDGQRADTRARLEETLRAWLLHQGRREDVAAALFVHPQTVRYRMGRVRELWGDALADPDVVRDLVVALA
ncbi:helix-turn-helix domain-containing protein [Nocardioides zeae]|uniref:Helix-turn-helix domain-containing protein n=1 Tax=Nocardioides imazamoxiresistens TaxID=3231893 RepID=A0ABU3PVS4_9ACTN|nr:helix-turn-helix domain-containing protein [Nocardioides zeae]MDT9593323.1 helix-turn-helix domain-containing protein [Nocardioides zeae]